MSDIENKNEELGSPEEANGLNQPEAEGKVDLPEQNSADNVPDSENNGRDEIDYATLARQDMEELKKEFPHLSGKTSIAELDNPLRYAALRDLGLTPREAFLATNSPVTKYDNRSHLSGAVPRRAGSASDMLGAGELMAARELFADLSDREIQKLYKKVSR